MSDQSKKELDTLKLSSKARKKLQKGKKEIFPNLPAKMEIEKIGKECIQCGKNTLLSCSNCPDPLCKECMNPKEPIEIPFYESSIPAGVCKKCITEHFIPEIYRETENKLKGFTDALKRMFD